MPSASRFHWRFCFLRRRPATAKAAAAGAEVVQAAVAQRELVLRQAAPVRPQVGPVRQAAQQGLVEREPELAERRVRAASAERTTHHRRNPAVAPPNPL